MTRNLSALLKKSLPGFQIELLEFIGIEGASLGIPVYIVGGLVRDLLLGHASFDFDLVVEGDAPALARVLAGKYGGKVTVHARFGTAKWDLQETKYGKPKLPAGNGQRPPTSHFLDLVSARSEVYRHPAALPTVKKGSIGDDLRRRDFTINTLALRLDGPLFGEVRDDFGGMKDIQDSIIRVIHPRSFIDDPTRMYRAVRYEQRLGFRIDDRTLNLIPEASSLIEKLSAQRIRHELDLILDETKASSILRKLSELNLITPIHSALTWDESIKGRFEARQQKNLGGVPAVYPEGREETRQLAWALWLLSLPEKQINSINKRLHFSNSQLKMLVAASRINSDLEALKGWKPSNCVEYLNELPLHAIYAVTLATSDKNLKLPLEKYIDDWRQVKPKTTAADLTKLGLTPGPNYRSILMELRNMRLDGIVKNEQEEKRKLEEILHKS